MPLMYVRLAEKRAIYKRRTAGKILYIINYEVVSGADTRIQKHFFKTSKPF